MQSKNLGLLYDDIIGRKFKLNIAFFLCSIILFIYIVPFLNYILFVDEEKRFPLDVAYVAKGDYDYTVERYSGSSINYSVEIRLTKQSLDINDSTYSVLYTQAELFDIGMVDELYNPSSANLYQFEFIHGHSFMTSDQIVITEKISQDLFQTSNSINQQIEINSEIFVVSGVIKNNDKLEDYIYMSRGSIDLSSIDGQRYNAGYLLKDDHIFWKLYLVGGYNLLTHTSSHLSQSEYPNFILPGIVILMIISLLTLFVIIESQGQYDTDEIKKRDSMIRIRSYKEL